MTRRWNHITEFPFGRNWELLNGFVAAMLVCGTITLIILVFK